MKQLSKIAFTVTFGLLILAIALGTPLAALAAAPQQITATPQVDNNLYGQAVAVYDDYAIVGVPEADTVAPDAGLAHIYKRVNNVWQQEATLMPELTPNAQFGYSVAIIIRDGVEYALVGAPQDGLTGAAYLYQRDAQGQWTQITTLRPESAVAVEFGYSVAIFQDKVLVGAPTDAIGGEVYLYKDASLNFTQLQVESKLSEVLLTQGITLLPGERFGEALDLAGNYMVVGAPDTQSEKGAAYLFEAMPNTEIILRSNLTEMAQPLDGSRFGTDVAVNPMGDVIIGAPHDSEVTAEAGAAFIMKRDAQVWQLQTKLMPLAEQAGAKFGTSVAIHMDKAIVGAPYADPNSVEDAGSVFVYRKEANTWAQRAVTPETLKGQGLFGLSVAIFDDLAIAGAPGFEQAPDLGSVLILRRDGFNQWLLDTKLTFEMLSQFGQSIAMYEDIMIIGAPEHDAKAQDAGAVYLYERDAEGQWLPAAMDPTAQIFDYKLSPQQQLQTGDMFGYAVDLHRASTGEYFAIVSAPYRDANGLMDSGAVYIFQRDEITKVWTEISELTGQVAYELFGFDVAISELMNVEHILIGAPEFKPASAQFAFGMAYLYRVDTFELLQSFRPTELVDEAKFGFSVDILADKLIIGAPYDETDLISDVTGAAYLYEAQASDWSLLPTYAKLDAQELQLDALFGYDVALTLSNMGEHIAVIGAPQDSTLAPFAGAAYVYKLDDATQIWEKDAQLLPDQINARFGESIALFQDTLLIGAKNENQTGAAYQFRLQEQTQTFDKVEKLTLPTLQQGDLFGAALAISGTDLMITAPMGDALLGLDSGFVTSIALGQ